jgi:hypothetical protein
MKQTRGEKIEGNFDELYYYAVCEWFKEWMEKILGAGVYFTDPRFLMQHPSTINCNCCASLFIGPLWLFGCLFDLVMAFGGI